MRDRDGNSRLFDKVANGKKVNKLICKLEREDGSIIDSDDEIITEIANFFKIFTPKNRGLVWDWKA